MNRRLLYVEKKFIRQKILYIEVIFFDKLFIPLI